MATGFKKATVNASDIPATQTNFPAYVDLSRVGITTLAEAQSVRVYADSSKTTEWAREIVSVTEMHVKIPSLTSTTDIYVSWDGSSADYAVTDTYGRNAVWSDYTVVLHMEEDPSGSAPQMVDSTGNGNNGTSVGSMTSGDSVTGKLNGKAIDFDATDDALNLTDIGLFDDYATAWTMTIWIYGGQPYMAKWSTVGWLPNGANTDFYIQPRNSATYEDRIFTTGSVVSTTAWNHIVYENTTSNVAADFLFYLNGSSQSHTFSDDQLTTQNIANTNNLRLHANDNTAAATYAQIYDEFRLRAGNLSANWITTEYANQNAESTFWGTWSNVSAGTTNSNFLMFM